jgi:hypothetical protein
MKYLYALPVVGILLVGGFAMAQTVSATHDAAADEVAANDTPAAAPDAAAGPDGDHAHWRHHHGQRAMQMQKMLDALPKPLSADAVKQALETQFAKRPHVQSVTEKDPNILVVEIVDRDGKTHRFELNRTTGDHRKAW